MSLSERLRRLRPDRGSVQVPGTSDIADRIRRLQARTGTRNLAPKACGTGEEALAALVAGRVSAPGVIRIERRLSLETRHGTRQLADLVGGGFVLPEAAGVDPECLLFLDTETTGLSGGSGSLAFILGLARMRRGDLHLCQWLLTRFGGERSMLVQAQDWIGADSALVSYNGKAFDLPLLSVRFRLAGVPNPFADRRHVDLLSPVRRVSGHGWEDCRLATAERSLIGLRRRDDLPGSQAPGAWLDYLQRGDFSRLPGVCRHNRLDLLSLPVLLRTIDELHRRPGAGMDLYAISRVFYRHGQMQRALRVLEDNQDNLGERASLELARLLGRDRRRDEAVRIWERLAGEGCRHAREHLAKYHEHVTGEYGLALVHARGLAAGPQRQHRVSRLQRKLGSAAAPAEPECVSEVPPTEVFTP